MFGFLFIWDLYENRDILSFETELKRKAACFFTGEYNRKIKCNKHA